MSTALEAKCRPETTGSGNRTIGHRITDVMACSSNSSYSGRTGGRGASTPLSHPGPDALAFTPASLLRDDAPVLASHLFSLTASDMQILSKECHLSLYDLSE